MRDVPELPAGAWDCPIRVIDACTDDPMVAERSFTATEPHFAYTHYQLS
ncbi:hypothetical protein LMG31506_04394 [Cupriavidus yeoncheonensis]|uniref:Uncharacterized protein n=1 Tax=Cupriavidus yeoncheonensis TaxID=1462994 RepID=A0A916J068_9BURK|nr:hypothetical protein LMG31506_04394 [Cupriavidus yeoncheonensis]